MSTIIDHSLTLDEAIAYRATIKAQIKALEDGDPEHGVPALKDLDRQIQSALDTQNEVEYMTSDDAWVARIVTAIRKTLDKDLLVQFVGTDVIAKCERETVVRYVRVDVVRS